MFSKSYFSRNGFLAAAFSRIAFFLSAAELSIKYTSVEGFSTEVYSTCRAYLFSFMSFLGANVDVDSCVDLCFDTFPCFDV